MGDLSIVENTQLWNLIKKGTKYRLPQRIDWVKNRLIVEEFLDTYIPKWIEKERKATLNRIIQFSSLDQWRKSILDLVDKKIELGKNKFKRTRSVKIEEMLSRN